MDKYKKNLISEYKSNLTKWNKTHNLISKAQIPYLDTHIEDCLIISGLLTENVVDLGSGGGLPGIPLAISNPEKKLYLVESNEKKAAFLLNTSTRLKLKNIVVINERMENVDPDILPEFFDIVCRAVGTAESIINSSAALLQKPGVSLKLMKTSDQFESEKIPANYSIKKIDELALKAKDKTRILVTIEADRNNG